MMKLSYSLTVLALFQLRPTGACSQVSEWEPWTECSADCGTGDQQRNRDVADEDDCPHDQEIRTCNPQACELRPRDRDHVTALRATIEAPQQRQEEEESHKQEEEKRRSQFSDVLELRKQIKMQQPKQDNGEHHEEDNGEEDGEHAAMHGLMEDEDVQLETQRQEEDASIDRQRNKEDEARAKQRQHEDDARRQEQSDEPPKHNVPKIQLEGPHHIILSHIDPSAVTLKDRAQSTYIDEGAECQDSDGVDISDRVAVSGDIIRITKLGTYNTMYECEDKDGNAANPVTRTVIVADTSTNTDTKTNASPALSRSVSDQPSINDNGLTTVTSTPYDAWNDLEAVVGHGKQHPYFGEEKRLMGEGRKKLLKKDFSDALQLENQLKDLMKMNNEPPKTVQKLTRLFSATSLALSKEQKHDHTQALKQLIQAPEEEAPKMGEQEQVPVSVEMLHFNLLPFGGSKDAASVGVAVQRARSLRGGPESS